MISFKEFYEIFQICIILFVVSVFVAFCISNIFIRADEEIDKITDKSSKNAAIIAITFLQLFITAIAYCLADELLHHIRPWEEIAKDIRRMTRKSVESASAVVRTSSSTTLGELNIANYGIHIVLLLLLLEMNTSLQNNLHKMADMIIVNK